jgi:hypothetical protein
MIDAVPASRLSASIPARISSQGCRSSSVSGSPADIFAMLASGWNWSPSM